MAGGVGPRRTVFRLLAGGALGILAPRLGLAEGAEAKQQRKRRTGPKPQGTPQAEGKGKRKKGKKKPKPQPPPCGAAEKSCADGDGTAVTRRNVLIDGLGAVVHAVGDPGPAW